MSLGEIGSGAKAAQDRMMMPKEYVKKKMYEFNIYGCCLGGRSVKKSQEVYRVASNPDSTYIG